MKQNKPPLVVIGIDAGDSDFIHHWINEGQLPNIASVVERGAYAKTSGPEMVSEHGVWPIIFSGQSRSETGYYYFRQLIPGDYDLATVYAGDFDVQPFWAQLGENPCRVTLLDIPDSYPCPGLPGLQVANWATHNNFDPQFFSAAAEPAQLLDEIVGEFGNRQFAPENCYSTLADDRNYRELYLKQIATKGRLCRYLIKRAPFDLFATVFAETHAASHQFWQYRPPVFGGKPDDGHGMGEALLDVYRAVDREIGSILEAIPEHSNIVILSSVGMCDAYPHDELLDRFCRELGYQPHAASNGISLHPLALARRLLPEAVRIRLSRRLTRDQRERLLADQWRRSTDWSRTTVFRIPAFYTGHLRVNLRGREPQGVVNPGAEYDAILDAVTADLEQLVDADSGEPAVKTISRTIEMWPGEPPAILPDLWVEWKHGRFMRRVEHPKATLEQDRPEFYRVSDHSREGFFAAAGPFIAPIGPLGDISPLDLAPTFLTLLRRTVPQAMAGTPLSGITAISVP